MTAQPEPYDPADTFTCESCQQTIPDDDRSECDHWPLCKGCAGEGFCLTCLREDRFWSDVDRAWDNAKDGLR
jgi:NAD-dependent SIR2 family protein deacetylase